MQSNEEEKAFVARELERLGINGATQYEELLVSTPENKVIAGLAPWAFLPTPERSRTYCSEALGRPVLPFAQAIGEDMMACFETYPSTNPAVVVINPWAQGEGEWVKGKVEIERLPDFDAWLAYAQKVSREVQAREQDEAADD